VKKTRGRKSRDTVPLKSLTLVYPAEKVLLGAGNTTRYFRAQKSSKASISHETVSLNIKKTGDQYGVTFRNI
jgi:hypothetical protein